jgi:hypothetical protein
LVLQDLLDLQELLVHKVFRVILEQLVHKVHRETQELLVHKAHKVMLEQLVHKVLRETQELLVHKAHKVMLEQLVHKVLRETQELLEQQEQILLYLVQLELLDLRAKQVHKVQQEKKEQLVIPELLAHKESKVFRRASFSILMNHKLLM